MIFTVSNFTKRVKNFLNRKISSVFKHHIKFVDYRKKYKNDVTIIETLDNYTVDLSNLSFKRKDVYWFDFKDKALYPNFIKEIKNAEIFNGGIVITQNNEIVLESTLYETEYLYKLNRNHYVFFKKLLPAKKVDKVICLDNFLQNNYYHWLMESVGRVVVGKNHINNGYKILLNTKLSPFGKKSLQFLFNFKETDFIDNKYARVKSNECLVISFPQYRNESTRWTNIYQPKVIAEINRLALKKTENLKPTQQKKNIIISRKNATGRRIINEELIIERFRSLNFEIVELETLSFEQQVYLFSNSGVIIATHGAGLVNLLFSKSPFVIEFFPADRDVRDAFYFFQITSALKIKHTIIEYESINQYQDMKLEELNIKQLEDTFRLYNII